MSKKGENIYKRKDNRWEARFIKGYAFDGSAKFGYCYAKTYKEVKEKLSEAKANYAFGRTPSNTASKRKFIYYCDEWLFLSRNRVKESTYVKYSGIVEKHIKKHLGGYYPIFLTSVIVEEFSNTLIYEEELSTKTVKDILIVLNSILKYVRKQLGDTMHSVDITYPKVPKNDMRVLSKQEQMRFVEYLLVDMDECKFGVLLALMTGMRIGEVCALKWDNISLAEKTIRIDSTMQRLKDIKPESNSKTKVIISKPKSDFSSRIIPITDYICKICNTQSNKSPSAFVLTGKKDKYIEPRTLQYRFEKYTKACGLEDVHFHTLRHTFATRCVEVNFEIKSLSEILGHSSPRITLERYVHSSLELKRDNMNKLEAIGF